MQGGKREGAGRKQGSVNRLSQEAIEAATKTGELPHEFLLRVSRGETIDGEKTTFDKRIDAAKAAGPYFAPRLATATIQGPGGNPLVVETTDQAVIMAEIRALLAADPELRAALLAG
jgi:hypothetical protein